MCNAMSNIMIRILAILVLITSLSGCLITQWKDVSSESEYHSIVELELTSKERLVAHGITMERNHEKILHHYSVTVLPGFSGPEVLSVTQLPVGTKFKIVKVLQCADCPFKREVIELVILNGPELEGAPLWFSYSYFSENKNVVFTAENT
jgi:hypothetical protein